MTEFASAYGSALYDIAAETNTLDEILEQTKVIVSVFKENPDFVKILDAPMISKKEKLNVVDETFKGKVNVYLLNFMKILVERGGFIEFENCAAVYEKQYNKNKNIEKVVAVTAIPLSESLSEKLTKKLEAVTGKTIVLENQVDPGCMGGVVLRLENSQIDGSVKTRLEAKKSQMFSIIA